MKITALFENTTGREDLSAGHGLSLLIETGSHKILFDMGQGDAFAKNAGLLGVNLEEVDLAILSHGHYDHGGGLGTFLECNRKAPVYLSRCAFEPHYHGAERYIGLDVSLQSSPRLRFVGEQAVPAEGLTIGACNRCGRRHPIHTGGLQVLENGALRPEDFRHELFLLAGEDGKRVLFSGCSHKGILDIVEWFRPDVFVGGFHLSALPLDETLAGCAKALDRFPTRFYTCHCTGKAQFEFMKQYMERLDYLSCGQEITV